MGRGHGHERSVSERRHRLGAWWGLGSDELGVRGFPLPQSMALKHTKSDAECDVPWPQDSDPAGGSRPKEPSRWGLGAFRCATREGSGEWPGQHTLAGRVPAEPSPVRL
ncbi:RAS protein activator like-3 [Platysternon megacephalum]|uniref:RAS protein activator like-3 n=1 Tax=Platysternon megacephalum TaxID=55544 RepID=A0A4D9DRF4_9SAUR|nr:RAS protein activator like-3 [Platysternon megacephalum]